MLEKPKKSREPNEQVLMTEDKAEVSFQALLNQTADGIVKLQPEDILRSKKTITCTDFDAESICSYGFGRGSGHSL